MGLSRFDRYLLSQLLALFGFFALVLVSVYWVNRAVGLFDKLLADGHSALVFLEFSLLMLPNVIRLVLPIAAFAAAVYVINRLTQESELVVMQATGFSAFRLARPVLLFGLFVAFLHLVLMNLLVPWAQSMYTERSAALSENVTARFLNAGQFMHPTTGVTLYIREITELGELKDLFLSDDRDDGERVIYTARKALLARADDGPKLLMFDGSVERLTTSAERTISVTRFSDFTFDLAGVIEVDAPGKVGVVDRSTANLVHLLLNPDEAKTENLRRGKIVQELNLRLAHPMVSVASAMIGFATLLLGAFSRLGLWRQILGAVAILILMQALNTVGSAATGKTPALWPLVYVAPLAGLAVSVAILWISQRPRKQKGAAA